MKFPGGRNLCEIGKERIIFYNKVLFTLFLGVQERVFESSSVKKGGLSNEAKQLLYSSAFFQPHLNRRKIASTSSSFLPDFNGRKNLSGQDQILPARSLRAANAKLVFSYSSFCFAGTASAHAEKECT